MQGGPQRGRGRLMQGLSVGGRGDAGQISAAAK